MSKRKPPSAPMRVNVPAYPDYWNKKPYKNPNVVSMEIRINNAVPVTYVLKKFKDGSYKFSTYQKNQTSKANLGNNYKCKPVLCYDLNGNFLKEYSSAYNANILLNFKKRDVGICLNANGKQKSSHGFIWKYKNK